MNEMKKLMRRMEREDVRKCFFLYAIYASTGLTQT